MLHEQGKDFIPGADRHDLPHFSSNFGISFHKLYHSPHLLVWRRNMFLYEINQFIEYLPMILGHSWHLWIVYELALCKVYNRCEKLFYAPVFCSNHGNNRYIKRLLEGFNIDMYPLRLCHIDHVHAHNHRRPEDEQF